MILDPLARAEQHVEAGANHIEEQRRLIAELQRDGHDTTEAQKLLSTYEQAQSTHIAQCERLRRELSENKDPLGR